MLGLDDYGSDDDTSQPSLPQPTPTTTKVVAPTKPRKPPKKIAIALPALPKESSEDGANEEGAERPLKRRKTGAEASSLLSMLPTPKQGNVLPAPQRILGGGSKGPMLTFRLQSNSGSEVTSTAAATSDSIDDGSETVATTLFRPTSVAKGKKNPSTEEHDINHAVKHQPQKPPTPPAIDFFSLGEVKHPLYILSCSKNVLGTTKKTTETSVKASAALSLPSASSAPALPSFEPPEPTQTDPYPGYYQLPSGTWAAYDTEYYGKFMKKWQDEYNAHVRALEKGAVKGFEGLEAAVVGEVDAMKEMERAKKEIQEREEKKAITMGAGGAPAAPRMTMTVGSNLIDMLKHTKIHGSS